MVQTSGINLRGLMKFNETPEVLYRFLIQVNTYRAEGMFRIIIWNYHTNQENVLPVIDLQ